jgi:hypothetical protein
LADRIFLNFEDYKFRYDEDSNHVETLELKDRDARFPATKLKFQKACRGVVKMSILDPNKSYTFSQIFELNVDALDLAPELGYSLIRNFQKLPQYTASLPRLTELRTNLEEVLPLIDLTSEQARREAIVSDLVKYLIRLTRARLSVEYPVSSGRLGGSLDYLVRTPI